jgi:tetratricopeptide (TPR) repeat protein
MKPASTNRTTILRRIPTATKSICITLALALCPLVSLLAGEAPEGSHKAPAHEEKPAEPAVHEQSPAAKPPTERETTAPVPASAASPTKVQVDRELPEDAQKDSSAVAIESSFAGLPAITNAYVLPEDKKHRNVLKQFQAQLEMARRARENRDFLLASDTLSRILDAEPPEDIKRPVMLEMAVLAQQQNELTKAQQILGQYVTHYAEDPSIPEVLLRQGLLYRQMGANSLALSKFYQLMTAALNLKLDRLEYYQRLVLHAQTEIAETYYLQGEYQQAADFFARLLKLESPDLNKSQIQFKLIRSLANLRRSAEVEAQAQIFLKRYPESPDQPEVRFLLATALRQQGRNSEALQQVLLLLQSQQAIAKTNPENWLYWQQRTGNDIANQLYREGDYVHALEIYFNLAQLDASPAWQFPVMYQIGLVYERLQQPEKAGATYSSILTRQNELGTNAAPSLKALVEMAQWRRNFLGWQTKTTDVEKDLREKTISVNATNAVTER